MTFAAEVRIRYELNESRELVASFSSRGKICYVGYRIGTVQVPQFNPVIRFLRTPRTHKVTLAAPFIQSISICILWNAETKLLGILVRIATWWGSHYQRTQLSQNSIPAAWADDILHYGTLN